MREWLLIVAICIYAPSVLSGCSIAMALSGTPEPNFDKIEVGATRAQVESEFKNPISSKVFPDGEVEVTYEYEMANSPNPGRAWVNFYVDLATFGLAEPILTIIEFIQPHDEETMIVYGKDNHVRQIRGYTPPPPSKVVIESAHEQEKYIEQRRKPKPAASNDPARLQDAPK